MSAARGGRVLVTGVGSVSALGVGGGAVLAAALARGVPGIGPVRGFPVGDGPSRLAAEVGDLAPHLGPEEARRLSRASQLAVVACRLALADAGLEPGAPGLGLVLGSAYGDFRSTEAFVLGFLRRGVLGLSPLIFPHTVMNAMAAQAAIAVGARGPMLTLNGTGIAGHLAVDRAAALVAAGRAPAVLAGGVDDLCPVLYRELGRLGVLSPGGGGPEGCRPFDRAANGSVAGEGATVLLLEAEATARARGARGYAELAGAATGTLPAGARGVPPPARRVPAAVVRALAAAGVAPGEVDAVYLTGAGEPTRDACELELVARALPVGRTRPRLAALTPLAGEHAGLGAMAVAAAAVLTLATGRLPAFPELRQPLREDLAFAGRGQDGAAPARTVLVHGLARGGGHAALLLRRPPAPADPARAA